MLEVHPARNTLRTVRDHVRWAASCFTEAGLVFGHGTDNALDEAAALVSHSLFLPAQIPDLYWDARITDSEQDLILDRVARRIETRLPLPYITGEAWFAGLPFHVDQRVLIPRSPIAELIDSGFSPWLDAVAVDRVLEIGTGSGCIAAACALAFPEAQVLATDVSADALTLAERNLARHGLDGQVQLLQSDVFEAVPTDQRFDLIVSNPPYVDAEDMAALPAEYRHEPRQALAAGDDGLAVVHRILGGAAARLTEHGILVCEVGNSEWALAEAYPQLPFLWLEFERGGHGVFLLTADQLTSI